MRILAMALAFGASATTAIAAPACKDWNDTPNWIASADLRTDCYMTRVQLEQILLDPTMMQFYQADVFVEGNRLVIFVSVVAG